MRVGLSDMALLFDRAELVIAMGALVCLMYVLALGRHLRKQEKTRRGRTLHFINGVCQENEVGVWRYLRHLGLRRELGKADWPEGHNRVLTGERGAYRPPRFDVYYWRHLPIWERPHGWLEGAPKEYVFRYAAISIGVSIISLILTVGTMRC